MWRCRVLCLRCQLHAHTHFLSPTVVVTHTAHVSQCLQAFITRIAHPRFPSQLLSLAHTLCSCHHQLPPTPLCFSRPFCHIGPYHPQNVITVSYLKPFRCRFLFLRNLLILEVRCIRIVLSRIDKCYNIISEFQDAYSSVQHCRDLKAGFNKPTKQILLISKKLGLPVNCRRGNEQLYC